MTPRPTPTSPFRVVVADDVADLRFLLTRALEASGEFKVVGTAGTGREAIAEAVAHQPDLTLLDLSMPEMDGLEALPLIRAAVPESTVVVLSGFDAEDVISSARERGAAGYLVKGLSPRRLVQELVVLLQTIQAGAERLPRPGISPDAEMGRARIDLPAELLSGRRARVFVAERLAEWGLQRLADTALLLTTELVTNAVVHARSAVGVTLRRTVDRVRVEVADVGGGALKLREPEPDAVGGRGLQLMEALAPAWGTSSFGAGKVVWFELPTSGELP